MATMLSMLGIQQVVVLINKMDLVGYRKKVYDEIVKEYIPVPGGTSHPAALVHSGERERG